MVYTVTEVTVYFVLYENYSTTCLKSEILEWIWLFWKILHTMHCNGGKWTILENLGNQCDLILDKIRNLYNSSFIYEYWTSIRTGGVHRWSM